MGKPNKEYVVPLWEKTNLTVYEAAAYSGIGADKLTERIASLFCGMERNDLLSEKNLMSFWTKHTQSN